MKNLVFEITIPVLNEEKTLKEKIEQTLNFFQQKNLSNFTLVIADNGSIDNTQKIGEKLEKEYSKVKYIRLNEKGVGLALQTSWNQSKADVVGYMDLDLATDLKHLLEIKELFEVNNIKVINASRLLKNSKVENRSILREITSRSFNFILNFILKVKFTDGMCGFKFFKRDVINNLLNTGIVTKSWFFSTEILVKAEWSDIEILELPVHWIDDNNSKVKIFSLSINYLKNIFRLKKEKKGWRK